MSTSLYAESIDGIDFPQTIAGFKLRSTIDNEKLTPGLGVTLRYGAPGVKISIFVYGHANLIIPDGIDSAITREHFANAREDIKNLYSDVQTLTDEQRFVVNGIPLLHFAYQYTESKPGSRIVVFSHLYFTAKKGNFIKIRVTYSSSDQPEVSMRMQTQFIEHLCQILANSSGFQDTEQDRAKWALVNEFGKSKAFVDLSSIKKRGSLVRTLVRYELNPPGTDKSSGQPVSEMLMDEEYDLKFSKFCIYSIQFVYLDGTKGDVMSTALSWEPATKGNLETLKFLRTHVAKQKK